MRQHRLDHLRPDAEHRVQRHHRILEDHRDAPAAEVAHLARRQPDEILALEQDAAADDPAGRIDEAEDREAGDRLARAGLADEPQHLAAADLEADAVDRLDDAPLGEEMRVRGSRP